MQKIILLLVVSIAALNANSIKHTLPQWMQNVKQPTDQVCTIGYGRASSKFTSEDAILTAKMELGLFESVEVKTKLTFSEMRNENGKSLKQVYTSVSKESGLSSAKDLRRVKNWISPKGDYFSLVCQNKNDKNRRDTPREPISIESFSQSSGVGDKEVFETYLRIEMLGKLNYRILDDSSKEIVVQKPTAKIKNQFSCIQSGFLAPEWTCIPMEEGMYVGVGVERVVNGNLADAYAMALVYARSDIAQQFGARFKARLEEFQRTTGTKSSKDIVKEKSTDQIVSQTLKHSNVLKVWYSKDISRIYVLVGVPERIVVKKVTAPKTDEALWQQFQSKKALDDLEKEFN